MIYFEQDAQSLQEILNDKSYDEIPQQDKYRFVLAIMNGVMFNQLLFSYDNVVWILKELYTNDDLMDYKEGYVYVKRILSSAIIKNSTNIYDVLSLIYSYMVEYNDDLDITNFYGILLKDTDKYDYVFEGVMSFLTENFVGIIAIAQMSRKVETMYKTGNFDFDKMTDEGRNEYAIYFHEEESIMKDFPFHFDLIGSNSEEEYIAQIYDLKQTQIINWSKGWPVDMYQKFIDAMPGESEQYYLDKVCLPYGEVITDEDFDFYEPYLNKEEIVFILDKEQLLKFIDKFSPEDIIKSNKFTITELKNLPNISLVIYTNLLYDKCLYEDEILENKELFNQYELEENAIWVSEDVWNEISVDQANMRYKMNSISSLIYINAADKTDFDEKYLEYLLKNVPKEMQSVLQILTSSERNIVDVELATKLHTINKLYK